MTVTVSVYDPTNTTEITPGGLVKSHDRKWNDPLSQPGSASVTVQNTDTQRAAMTFGRVLRWSINGTARFASLIEAKAVATVAPGEEAEQVTKVDGRGTMARWEDFVVYPEGGVGAVPLGDTRTFNFASSYYDDTTWTAAVQIEQGTGDPGGPRAGFPVGLPAEAETAWWIQSQANDVNGSVPAGDMYFRKTYVSPGELVRIVVTADNAHELWLNGQLVEVDSFDRAGGIGWAGVKTVDIYLPTGSHLFAVKVTNVAGVDPNPSGFILAAIRLENAGSTYGATVLVSDSSWKALGYPASPPGFTPRRVLDILLTEAKARGAVPELTLGASNAADSDLTPWPVAPDIAFRIGLNGLEVLAQLAESYIDCAMSPTSMRLDVWVHGGKGGASGVTYAAGVNITSANHQIVRPDLTDTLTRWAQGWQQVGASPPGRIEGFLSAGDAQSPAESGRLSAALIARMSNPAERIQLTIEPTGADVPYANWVTGDTVTAPDHLGTPTLWRAVGIGVTEDGDGFPYYVPELETP